MINFFCDQLMNSIYRPLRRSVHLSVLSSTFASSRFLSGSFSKDRTLVPTNSVQQLRSQKEKMSLQVTEIAGCNLSDIN